MKHNHYKRDVSQLQVIDVYRVIELFGVTCPVAQHVLKKSMAAGQRLHKDLRKDWEDIRDSAERRLQMMDEDRAAYFALAGEAAVRDRNGGWTDKAIKAAALPGCGPMCATCRTIHGTQDRCPAIEPASAIDDSSERMQAIGQNGEMASEVYAAVDGAPSWRDAPSWAQWLAQDSGGRWHWFECPIYADSDYEEWYEQEGFDGGVEIAGESEERNENWSKTMQARPVK